MLCWMCGKTRTDRVTNEDIRSMLGVAHIDVKMHKYCSRWFWHVRRMPISAPCTSCGVEGLGSF